MKIYVTVKQLGKKKPKLKRHPIDLPALNQNANLSEFLAVLVEQQVSSFNNRLEKPNLLPVLDSEQIADSLNKGKVDFGNKFNNEKEDPEGAKARAELAYKDGLFAVFIDDEKIETLEQTTNLKTESVVTFIRLTFLSGSWF